MTRKNIDKEIRKKRDEVTKIDAELGKLGLLARRGIKLRGVTNKEFLTRRAVLKARKEKAQKELIGLREKKKLLDANES